MSEPFLGEIIMFGGNFPPRGWAFCQGQLMAISQHTALFSILGTTYGGDGVTTFALPDFRGRGPIGPGQGPGLSNYVIGEEAGTENTTLLITQMPAHNHTAGPGTLAVRAKNTRGDSQSPIGAVPAIESAGVTSTYSTGTPDADMASPGGISGAPLINVAGGSQPFSIRNPFLVVSFIIALEGIFPSRN